MHDICVNVSIFFKQLMKNCSQKATIQTSIIQYTNSNVSQKKFIIEVMRKNYECGLKLISAIKMLANHPSIKSLINHNQCLIVLIDFIKRFE